MNKGGDNRNNRTENHDCLATISSLPARASTRRKALAERPPLDCRAPRAPADAAIPAGVRAAWMGSAVQVFTMNRMPAPTRPLALSAAGGAAPSVRECVDRVLRLLSVGSKRFLTSKVDRSVTGLIAQQQTVGPLQASRWR